MVPALCRHPLKTGSINKCTGVPLGPPCAEGAGGPQSREKTAGHELGARGCRADGTRGMDWPWGGQARCPLGGQGLFSGKPDPLLLRRAKLAPEGAPWPGCLVTGRHSGTHTPANVRSALGHTHPLPPRPGAAALAPDPGPRSLCSCPGSDLLAWPRRLEVCDYKLELRGLLPSPLQLLPPAMVTDRPPLVPFTPMHGPRGHARRHTSASAPWPPDESSRRGMPCTPLAWLALRLPEYGSHRDISC